MEIFVTISYSKESFEGDHERFLKDFPLSYTALGLLINIISQPSPIRLSLSELPYTKREDAICHLPKLLAANYLTEITYEAHGKKSKSYTPKNVHEMPFNLLEIFESVNDQEGTD